MTKKPNIKIGDRICRRTDEHQVYYGVCTKMTEKCIRCKWDHLPDEFTTTLLYKNYGEFWQKIA